MVYLSKRKRTKTEQQEKLGKTVGDGFLEGKITLPVILAFRRGDDKERAFWCHTLEKQNQQDDDLARARELMAKHSTLADSLDRARHYASSGPIEA